MPNLSAVPTSASQATNPAVSAQVKEQANLRLLQRTCSREIVAILHSATHVVLYEFRDGAWFKCDKEGSCFLTYTPTTYIFTILNRNSNDNFQMILDQHLQMQHQPPYLIFKQPANQQIMGVWFHNDDERELMQIAMQASLDRVQHGYGTPARDMTTIPADNSAATTPRTMASPTTATSVADATAALSALFTNDTATTATVANAADATGLNTPGVALDKKSLQLALLSLIQDDRFLDLLHSQYLKVVRTRTRK